MAENVVLCGANSYEEKYYFNRDIGSALKIKQYQTEKRELLESLELYYRTFFMGSGKGPGNGGEDSGL